MEAKPLSKRKSRLFKVLAFFVPILFLLFIEISLRLFGYGHNTSLFIKYPDDANYWVMNKYASERYFSDTANATKGGIELFKVIKPKNTFRIFVLGESTTAGYPYFHNGSFHRWLQYRLMHTYPDVHFEVINVSLTAVNSYTVLDFGKQVVDYQPDAVLVYTGHNEYYGALGIGSTSHIANNRLLVKTILELRKLRLVQLIENGIGHFKKHASNIDERENLMKRMAASQLIPYGSADYNAGINQFKSNMEELCALMQDKRIPVFLSTVVSNEKDIKPFINSDSSYLLNATAQFNSADAAFKSGNYVLAKQQYIKAKELDGLRFRAPEDINKIIVELTQNYKNVHLVNTGKVFEDNSPHQIIGNELLLEHVHPNLMGYALLSEAFYQSLIKEHLIKAIPAKEITITELLKQMPITKVDSLLGAYTVMMLETGWPFNKPIPDDYKRGNSMEEQLAGALSVNRITWLDAMNQLFKYSMNVDDKKTALKADEAVMLEYPQNLTYKLFAGRLSFELGNNDNAVYYFKSAYDIDSSFVNTQNMYLIYLKMDQPQKALEYINLATAMQTNNYALTNLKTTVTQIIQLKNNIKLAAKKEDLNEQIAYDYHMIGMDETANKYDSLIKK